MPREHILVVEDDEDILEVLVYHLAKTGYKVTCLETGENAFEEIRIQQPQLVLLDLMLPEINGIEICHKLKANSETREIPVVMLTAKDKEDNIIEGFDAGAADYVTKPFSSKILLARIKAALQYKIQKDVKSDKVIFIHSLRIDPERFEVNYKDLPIKLTLSEFRIIHYLASQPGRVFNRYQIVDATREEGISITDRTIDVQIVGLRKKLGEAGKLIETVRGVGYRFKG